MTVAVQVKQQQRQAGRRRRGLGAPAAGLLLVASLDASALSLGRVQGVPVIGQPLQLSVPAVVPADDESACVRAELLQGDAPATPLATRIDRSEPGRATLLLNSRMPVEEPVLTVNVTIGCRESFTRGYVLLAEPPGRLAAAPERVEVAPPPVVAAPRPASVEAPASASAAQPAAPARSARRRGGSPAPASAAAASRRSTARAPSASPAAAAGVSRLKLEVLDVEIDQAPALRISSQLAPAPAGAPALSRTEAAAAWQQINAPLEQQMAALQKQAQANEAELRQLRDVTRRQSDDLRQLASQRDRLRDILAALAGVLAVGLGLVLWRRARRVQGRPWWQPTARAQAAAPEAVPEPAVEVEPLQTPQQPAAIGPAPAPSTGPVTPEQLLDVRDKATFFQAVDQPEQAMQLLEAHLMEHAGGAPYLWLELLDLQRRHDRRTDYERVGDVYRKVFGVPLPAFGVPLSDPAGLEQYPSMLLRVQRGWPSRQVLGEIERALQDGEGAGALRFDLEASRDLLLLYTIAQELPLDQPLPLAAPAAAATAVAVAAVAATEVLAAPERPDLDLELDFSELPEPPAAPAPPVVETRAVDLPLLHEPEPPPADAPVVQAQQDASLEVPLEFDLAEVAAAAAEAAPAPAAAPAAVA
ncbi:MAG TPA: hypothetical protein VEA40_27875, partial [Ramlibacter sp.]|nr:hypothetical protein [Ramlibacter sp.]